MSKAAKPNRIEFEDLFNRFDYTFLINKGNQILIIDSLKYENAKYIIKTNAKRKKEKNSRALKSLCMRIFQNNNKSKNTCLNSKQKK